VFLAAILPTGDVAGQILLVGLLFAVIAVFSDTGWALAAGSLRSWFARFPQRLGLVGAVGGLGIAAVGLGVLVTGRKD
jgi:threonine/homoserine/homoserine lactone efflux protein